VYRIEYSDWILVCTDMFMGKWCGLIIYLIDKIHNSIRSG
jgi:hypothetical protein